MRLCMMAVLGKAAKSNQHGRDDERSSHLSRGHLPAAVATEAGQQGPCTIVLLAVQLPRAGPWPTNAPHLPATNATHLPKQHAQQHGIKPPPKQAARTHLEHCSTAWWARYCSSGVAHSIRQEVLPDTNEEWSVRCTAGAHLANAASTQYRQAASTLHTHTAVTTPAHGGQQGRGSQTPHV